MAVNSEELRSAILRRGTGEKPKLDGFRDRLDAVSDLQTLAGFTDVLVNRARREAERGRNLYRRLARGSKAQAFDLTRT
jgi:hypothetical protein